MQSSFVAFPAGGGGGGAGQAPPMMFPPPASAQHPPLLDSNMQAAVPPAPPNSGSGVSDSVNLPPTDDALQYSAQPTYRPPLDNTSPFSSATTPVVPPSPPPSAAAPPDSMPLPYSSLPLPLPKLKKTWSLSKKITVVVIFVLVLVAAAIFISSLLVKKPVTGSKSLPPAGDQKEVLVRVAQGSSLELKGLQQPSPDMVSLKQQVSDMQKTLKSLDQGQKNLEDSLDCGKDASSSQNTWDGPMPYEETNPFSKKEDPKSTRKVRYSADLATLEEPAERKAAKWEDKTRFYGDASTAINLASSSVHFSSFS